ncbi:MAG: DinB family protein [Vicinamibacterales bacterium]
MAAADALLPEFDHETAVARVLLERLPDGGLDWRPHEKSYSLGELAAHLAQIPHWGHAILDRDSYDMAGATPGARRPDAPTTRPDILAAFDRTVAGLRRDLVDRTDAELEAPWKLLRDGEVLLMMPRVAAVRRFILHHLIHHRGQLTVYLRLRDVPLPPLYGPTADERP